MSTKHSAVKTFQCDVNTWIASFAATTLQFTGYGWVRLLWIMSVTFLWYCSSTDTNNDIQASSKCSLQTQLLQKLLWEDDVDQKPFWQHATKEFLTRWGCSQTLWLQDLYMGLGNRTQTYTCMVYQWNMMLLVWQTAFFIFLLWSSNVS